MNVELRKQIGKLRVMSEGEQHWILVGIVKDAASPLRQKLVHVIGYVLRLNLWHAGWWVGRQHGLAPFHLSLLCVCTGMKSDLAVSHVVSSMARAIQITAT